MNGAEFYGPGWESGNDLVIWILKTEQIKKARQLVMLKEILKLYKKIIVIIVHYIAQVQYLYKIKNNDLIPPSYITILRI